MLIKKIINIIVIFSLFLFSFVDEDPLIPRKLPLDNTHPDWKDIPCLFYKDHNVLLEGEKQAKILTKSVEIIEGLPERVNNLITEHDEEVEKLIFRYKTLIYLF